MQICDHPDCIEMAEYRAPKSRMSRESYWFCLEHVRIYNREWDYYKGMTTDEIEADKYCDMTWRRATLPLGSIGNGKAASQFLYDDPLGIIGDYLPQLAPTRPIVAQSDDNMVQFPHHSPEEQALKILNLRSPVAIDTIKATYKEIARRLHPDLTNNQLPAKEREQNEKQLKKVNYAYHIIKLYLKKES